MSQIDFIFRWSHFPTLVLQPYDSGINSFPTASLTARWQRHVRVIYLRCCALVANMQSGSEFVKRIGGQCHLSLTPASSPAVIRFRGPGASQWRHAWVPVWTNRICVTVVPLDVSSDVKFARPYICGEKDISRSVSRSFFVVVFCFFSLPLSFLAFLPSLLFPSVFRSLLLYLSSCYNHPTLSSFVFLFSVSVGWVHVVSDDVQQMPWTKWWVETACYPGEGTPTFDFCKEKCSFVDWSLEKFRKCFPSHDTAVCLIEFLAKRQCIL
jgi:hypothetical protein